MDNNLSKIFTALADFQGEVENIDLNSSVKVVTKANKEYSFNYATLGHIVNQIRPIMKKFGLSSFQGVENGMFFTTIGHNSGERLVSSIPLPSFNKTVLDPKTGEVKEVQQLTVQELGGIFTYFRRYGLCVALGIIAEDDVDANDSLGNDFVKTERPTKTENDWYVSAKTGGVKYKGVWFNDIEAKTMIKAKEDKLNLDEVARNIVDSRNK